MTKKIIRIEEFFRLKEMLSGSKEDQQVAWHIYKNNYPEDMMMDTLMHKALVFKNRRNFGDAISFHYHTDTIKIYAYIDSERMDQIYNEILDKIMRND